MSEDLFVVLSCWLPVLLLCCCLKTYRLLVHMANVHLFPLLTFSIAIQCLLFAFFVEVSRCQSSLVVAANNEFSASFVSDSPRPFSPSVRSLTLKIPVLWSWHTVIKSHLFGIISHHCPLIPSSHGSTKMREENFLLQSCQAQSQRENSNPCICSVTFLYSRTLPRIGAAVHQQNTRVQSKFIGIDVQCIR